MPISQLSTLSPHALPQDSPHPNGQLLDFAKARGGVVIERGLIQQEQLSFGEQRGEGIGQVVAQAGNAALVIHSDQRPIEIPDVMFAQALQGVP